MAKEMKVECDFVQKSLICELPPHTLDVMLKVRTRSGEHTFREDVYTRSIKYRRWNNQMRPFQSLKRRVANIFRKRRSSSDDSWGDSTQSIINWEEEVQSETNSSVLSDWSDQLLVNDSDQPTTSSRDKNSDNKKTDTQSTPVKRTEKSVVLVPYKPKPKNWGSWRTKNSIYVNSNTKITKQNSTENLNNNNNSDVEYVPSSPYYSPVHSPQFYETGIN